MVDEHEARQAPFRGSLGFPRKGRDFVIKAMRGKEEIL
jgi:hypothetical protein